MLVSVGLVLAIGGIGLALKWGGELETYTVKGRVAGVEDEGRTLYVEHEKIPGYMPAMTMPLPVADPGDVTSLEQDDAIQFQMKVTGDSAWIDVVETIADTAVDRHPARSIQPIAGASEAGGQMLQEGDRVPADLTLTTQAGEPIRLGEFRGQVLVLTFIYTRCPLPNYCPLMSRQFAALQPKLRKQFGSKVHLLSVSFDPAHDTPAMLRDYASRYTDRLDTWTFATGDSAEVARITNRFGVFTKTEGEEITHNLVTAVVGPDGTLKRLFRGNDWSLTDVLTAVRKVPL